MQNKNSLVTIVIQDIQQFLEENKELLFNERDFQARLSLFLFRTGHYSDVDLEYRLPKGFNTQFDADYNVWKTETPSIDIVVSKFGEYLPIELKYKLKEIIGSISRFGEKASNIQLVTTQAAQNLGRYAFWKDVKRLELVKKHYKHIHHGIAVFLTNDSSYLKATKGANYYSFRMVEGETISGHLDWTNPNEDYPAFDLDQNYSVVWHTTYVHELMPVAYYSILTI